MVLLEPLSPRMPTILVRAWAALKAAVRVLVGPLGVALVLLGAVILVAMGFKELQVGGLVARLLGRKGGGNRSVDLANSIPEGRVDAQGRLIPVGEPDTRGQTQAVVVPIEEPGLLSNPDTVRFIPPGETKPVEMSLPIGVKNRDVDQVIVVTPSVVAVTVKDSSGIATQTVDDLLRKYAP